MRTLNVKLNIENAIRIELDAINSDGTATLFVQFGNADAYHTIELTELQRMCELGSFTWTNKQRGENVIK